MEGLHFIKLKSLILFLQDIKLTQMQQVKQKSIHQNSFQKTQDATSINWINTIMPFQN